MTGVNHRFAAIVVFQFVGKGKHRIHQRLHREVVATHLHIDKRNQVLILLLHYGGEVEELLLHRHIRAEEVVCAHMYAVLARILNVVLIVSGAIGGALGGFHIHEFDVLVLSRRAPVDVFLIARHVDAVVNQICRRTVHGHLRARNARHHGEQQHRKRIF